LYIIGFAALDEPLPTSDFFRFMGLQLLMNTEIAGICFVCSSLSGKNRMGAGIGLAMIFYVYDIIGRVVPDLKDALVIGPYSYANASEILSGAETSIAAVVIAVAVTIICAALAFVRYNRRDLAA
jgi:ABC-2 type transport system permease protein